MSTVNLTETLILLRDRQPQLYDDLEEAVWTCGVRFVPPTFEHARAAAAARLRFPLNLGDCFAYALAVVEGTPVLTLDRAFARVDVPVLLPPK
jgi:ribonuclease VapC